MPGIADYLNRPDAAKLDTYAARLVALCRDAHSLATDMDADRRQAELAQMDDLAIAGDLEEHIQKFGAIKRDVEDFCTKMRKHGVQTAARLIEQEATLRVKYDSLVVRAQPLS